MKHFFIFLAGSMLWRIMPANSQFLLTASTPADGAANVPLATIVSFTFSAPLDTAARFQEDSPAPLAFLDTAPKDSVILGAISYSPDLTTISVEITHTANTDFVWLLTGARSNAGEPLAQPYVLNYTTSATFGERTVSGTVTLAGVDAGNALVALQDRPLFSDEGIVKIGAVVPTVGGAYIVNYVRDGVYWPAAAKDIDGDGQIDPAGSDVIGFYDPNNDGQPDSIVVAGANLTGIDMALRQLFVPVTAKSYVDDAKVIAQQYAPDQELRSIGVHADPQGIDVGADGTAVMWAYQFFSPSLQFHTFVIMSSFFTLADTSRMGLLPIMRPIPSNFIDSNVAMAIAEANGGSDFTAQHNLVRRTLYGGNWAWRFLPQDSTKIFWVAEYEAIEPVGSPLIFRAFVDMITGELITDVEGPAHSAPAGFVLYQNYPNPFNPTTTIRFSLPQKAQVTLKVYDLLGREVAILVDGAISSGQHSVVFEARGFATGIYFYRMQTERFTQTRKFLILK
jgi:hypothetical protein